jgi:hypothetical protein
VEAVIGGFGQQLQQLQQLAQFLAPGVCLPELWQRAKAAALVVDLPC